MAKILITGNGFDLFHHLPTKYQHFMSVMKTIENNQFNSSVSFDELFGLEFKGDSITDYNAIVDNYKVENILFNHEKVKRIKEMLKDNPWYKHFKTVIEIDTWIDFEIEIENLLNQLVIFRECNNPLAIGKNKFLDKSIPYASLEMFAMFDIVSIINIGGAFSLKEKYLNKRKSLIEIKYIFDDLAQTFEEFVDIFNCYLVDVVRFFYQEVIHKNEIPFHLMDQTYTFNYTPTLEIFYNVQNSKIVYIHGKINEDCQKQNLVLGVSEVSEEARVNKRHGFSKYYQKANKNLNSAFIDMSNYNGGVQTIFYIIGHSMNESDRSYIISLFEFIEIDKNKSAKICIFYFSNIDKENKLNNLFSTVKKELVIQLLGANRLYFVVLNTENIINEFAVNLKRKGGWG